MAASQDQSGKKSLTRKLTRQDLEILASYVSRDQAQRYWAYLATIGETYAALAPGNFTGPSSAALCAAPLIKSGCKTMAQH